MKLRQRCCAIFELWSHPPRKLWKPDLLTRAVRLRLDFCSDPVTLARMNNLLNVSPQALRRAADLQERIDELQSELSQLLAVVTPARIKQPRGRRKLSAQGLANIRAGAKRRWAAFRAGRPAAATPKRRMSAAAKAKLAAIARARWRRAKAAGRSAL